ncbi:hypothetical protein AADW59_00130 [Candidatus Hodgkinia cicadicola]
MINACKAIGEVLKWELTKQLTKDKLVTGAIVHKNDSFMMISVDYKHDVKFPNSLIWNHEKYQTNSDIPIYIIKIESQPNQTELSRGSLDSEEAWKALTNAQLKNTTVNGTIESKLDEGYVVNVMGLTATLPDSLIDKSLQSHPLIGYKAKLKVFELDKAKNIIKLRLIDTREETEAHNKIQPGEEAWGVIKDVSNEGLTIDLCLQDGTLLLQQLPWNEIERLTSESKLGQIIESQNVSKDDENLELILHDATDTETEESKAPSFGIITEATRYEATVQTTENEYGIISAITLETEDLLKQLESYGLVIGDLVKTIPYKLPGIDEKHPIVDVDLEAAQSHKYVTLNHEGTVMGTIVSLKNNTIIVALTEELFGKIDADTPEQALEAFESLKNKTVELKVVDYDPDSDVMSLEIVGDECATALLVEK